MVVFLTSSPCSNDVPEHVHIPCILNKANGFIDNLSQCWKPDSRFLIISASPDNYALNDEMAETFRLAFGFHGLTLSEMAVCDDRNAEQAPTLVKNSDVILLAGGHVPTQNAFFHRIWLKSLLQGYEGIIIGISAGTMNSAKTVYAQPELPGESIRTDYRRFIPGLGLTDVMVLPHYQEVRDNMLDGKRLFEDITYPDSMGRKFYALVDGSYLWIRNGKTELYGEGYRIQDGRISQISSQGKKVRL